MGEVIRRKQVVYKVEIPEEYWDITFPNKHYLVRDDRCQKVSKK